MAFANILIVDDEADLKKLMKRGLEITGFNVKSEYDPLEALANFRAEVYSLVLLDDWMLNMDGFELYERLSHIDGRMKVCFLPAFDVEYFEKFKARFPYVATPCFIKKPVSIKDLTEMVKAELGSATEA